MSHTFDWKDPETGDEWYIHHNGDYSGDATITESGGMSFKVPARMLADFSRDAVIRRIIGLIQDWSDDAGPR